MAQLCPAEGVQCDRAVGGLADLALAGMVPVLDSMLPWCVLCLFRCGSNYRPECRRRTRPTLPAVTARLCSRAPSQRWSSGAYLPECHLPQRISSPLHATPTAARILFFWAASRNRTSLSKRRRTSRLTSGPTNPSSASVSASTLHAQVLEPRAGPRCSAVDRPLLATAIR